MIDSIAMKLVVEPQRFDVVVTTNQFGDILTDIGAGLVGGLGLAPGLCVGEKQAMAQATHGSAPDISGRNIANPYAMIMSGQMLMGWLGRKHKDPKASRRRRADAEGGDQGDRRRQDTDARPRRQRQHHGDGRRDRRRGLTDDGNNDNREDTMRRILTTSAVAARPRLRSRPRSPRAQAGSRRGRSR